MANGKALIIILLASIALLPSCSNVKERNEAEALALRVHEQLRTADFATIYEESESRFKTVGTKSEFITSMRGFQEQLGNFRHAEALGYEVKLDSRIGKMHQLYFDIEYERGRVRKTLIMVRSRSGKMGLWALEIEPST